MSEPKFCRDCGHCWPRRFFFLPSYEFAKCLASPLEGGDFLVTGKRSRRSYYYCSTMRDAGEGCGPAAKLFVPHDLPAGNGTDGGSCRQIDDTLGEKG